MQLHGHKHHVTVTGRCCSQPPDEATLHAAELAYARAGQALRDGKLLSPGEALALAGPEARTKETLFSIARTIVWEHGGNLDEVVNLLGERFPDLA